MVREMTHVYREGTEPAMRDEEDRLVAVATAPSQLIAEMWRGMLQEEGIPAVVQTSDGYAYLGALSPCRVLVSAYQADAARSLLEAQGVERGAGVEGEPSR
jgi:hypothetical protein